MSVQKIFLNLIAEKNLYRYAFLEFKVQKRKKN